MKNFVLFPVEFVSTEVTHGPYHNNVFFLLGPDFSIQNRYDPHKVYSKIFENLAQLFKSFNLQQIEIVDHFMTCVSMHPSKTITPTGNYEILWKLLNDEKNQIGDGCIIPSSIYAKYRLYDFLTPVQQGSLVMTCSFTPECIAGPKIKPMVYWSCSSFMTSGSWFFDEFLGILQ